MNWTKPLTITLLLAGATALASCGESADEAYDRGYEAGVEDGANAVCGAVEDTAPAVARSLESQRLC